MRRRTLAGTLDRDKMQFLLSKSKEFVGAAAAILDKPYERCELALRQFEFATHSHELAAQQLGPDQTVNQNDKAVVAMQAKALEKLAEELVTKGCICEPSCGAYTLRGTTKNSRRRR